LLDVFETELKEALPRRYGNYEPPQYLYAERGRDDFLAFLKEHIHGLFGMVWYPTLPVTGVHLQIPETIGGSKQGFRTGQLTLTIDADALAQPGWETNLRRFWLRLNPT